MKRFLLGMMLLLGLGLSGRAQVVIINDNMLNRRLSEIKTTVLDSLTREPICFASVYVIPAKDTVITNFTVSDTKGEAVLDEVPFGEYEFHVEMMGYHPFVKRRYFRERREDMGTVLLREDELFLQAATVSAVGNPIVVKQDTVEFNASSFQVGANAMLKDLLLRMPGMEITDDGKVKFNGEEIDKLTVGGRTFFFNDQSTALNNLPASIVDKIRVIDRESQSTRNTGIQDGGKEKILDVALKKEYEKGWFGNVGLNGGTTIAKKKDDPLRDNRGFLFSANALASAYTEKDQVTLIGNGQNVTDGNMQFVIIRGGDMDSPDDGAGLSLAAQGGVNYNTSRIKDVETSASANYKFASTNTGSLTDRLTYQDDGDLASTTESYGKRINHSAGANLEMKKEKGKVQFHFNPSYNFSHTVSSSTGSSKTLREEELVNNSESETASLSQKHDAEMDGAVSFRELGGKEKRIISLSVAGSYQDTRGGSDERSIFEAGGNTDTRALHYDNGSGHYAAAGGLSYTEPLGKKWLISAEGRFGWSVDDSRRNAFDEGGANEYYSSINHTRSLKQRYSLFTQYQFGERSFLTFGVRVHGVLNEVYTKSFGIEDTTGEGEWSWFASPNVRLRYGYKNGNFNVGINGSANQPSTSRMLPTLNISNPSRLTLGNVYLRPYGDINFNAWWSHNNREKFSSVMVYFFGSVTTRPVTTAQWYDAAGILYAIPVNSRKPTFSGQFNANWTTPLDKKKNLFLTIAGGASYTYSTSYQARRSLAGLDKDHFDYSDFMTTFWGDESGTLFYDGTSGFGESTTQNLSPFGSVDLKYNYERLSVRGGVSMTGRIARYSLNPAVNMNTLDTRISAEASYTTKHEFTFETDLTYAFFKGYSAEYGKPEWQWNAEISKNIKAFTLSIKVHDILNQTRSLSHYVTANYKEDSYRLVMGRYILFGVKWNFGKMNASHSNVARSAAWDMAW